MRLVAWTLAALLLVLGAGHALRIVEAEEREASGLTEAEAKRLASKLRSKASDWWRHRKPMVEICPQCKGRGQVRWRRGRRRVLVDCPKCDGNKIDVDKDDYRYCFYDRRSPAFRLQEGIRARVTQEYLQARSGQPAFPTILKRYSIKEVEIVDATHGVVYVTKNRDSVARPQRWIWAQERGKSPTWWLYDEQADGPWPGTGATPAAEVPVAPEPKPVEPAPVAPEPVMPQPVPEAVDPPPVEEPDVERVAFEEGQALVATWTKERNQLKARLIRVDLALGDVEGHEQTVADARTFLDEIRTWLKDAEPAYERARADVDRGVGVRREDRLKVNTGHFKSFRRMDLIYKMLVVAAPDLDD